MAHPYGHYRQVDLGLRKLGLSELPPIVKFAKLPIGARFRFYSEILFPFSGMESGPFIKTGARTYARVDKMADKIRVGKIGVETFQVEAGNPCGNPPVPGLSGWSMHAGGTAGGGKHGYTFTTGAWPEKQYHISPFTTARGRFAGYRLQATPGAVGLWEDLGIFRSPQQAAKTARTHYAQTTGNPPGKWKARKPTAGERGAALSQAEQARIYNWTQSEAERRGARYLPEHDIHRFPDGSLRRYGAPASNPRRLTRKEADEFYRLQKAKDDSRLLQRTAPPDWQTCGHCGAKVPGAVFTPSPYHLPGCIRYQPGAGRKRNPPQAGRFWELPERSLGGGWYRLKAAEARRLAGGQLPRAGYERKVNIEGIDYWIAQTQDRGALVWSIRPAQTTFGPFPMKVMGNPPVKVYERVNEIIAVKGPGHRCDAACKRARHTYRHKFTGKASVWGNPDGTLTVA